MQEFLALLEPKNLIETVGLVGILAVVFAESGLFFGFFLPGDSLLFTAGLLASQGYFNIFILAIGLMISAIVGDSVGYAFGKKVGPALFKRPESRFFKPKHLEKAKEFYEKYGVKAIVIARFVPIVRTFAPIAAGAAQMKYKTFITFNIIGGIGWVILMTMSGYFLGRIVPGIDRYLHLIVIGIIIVSFIPIIREWWMAKGKRSE
jgi:membrane-associated protein